MVPEFFPGKKNMITEIGEPIKVGRSFLEPIVCGEKEDKTGCGLSGKRDNTALRR